MCSKKTLDKIEKGEALVITKVQFVIWMLLIIVGAALSYGDLRAEVKQSIQNDIRQDRQIHYMEEIRFNLRAVCGKLGVEYIEKTKEE